MKGIIALMVASVAIGLAAFAVIIYVGVHLLQKVW